MRASSLTRARDFERVRADGRRARSDGIVVIAAPSRAPEAGSRLGLAVGRSAGSAVTRNRIKRRVRAAWPACAPELPHDVIVRPAASVATLTYQDLVVHLKRALTRAIIP